MKIFTEKTDTWGKEANYSWVERSTITLPENITEVALARRVKAVLGWTGIKCDREDWGDTIVYRPRNLLQVAFVTFE